MAKFATKPPERVARTRLELARLLASAGEYVRAEQLLGGKFDDHGTAEALLRLAKRDVAPLVNTGQRYKRQSRASKTYLDRVRRLYWGALEDGREAISLEELRECLDQC
jgi:hypothetical protein